MTADEVTALVNRIANRVDFDPESHIYRVDGKQYPSVTQILGRAGFDDWIKYVPEATLEHARDRGKAVHAACHYLDEDDLDIDSIDQAIVPYVEQYREWKAFTNFDPIVLERPLINRKKGFAGTPDKIGLIGGELCLLDVKTAAAMSEGVALQLMAYADLLDRTFACRRIALRLTGSGRPECCEYLIYDAVNRDVGAWRAALSLWQWRSS